LREEHTEVKLVKSPSYIKAFPGSTVDILPLFNETAPSSDG